MIKELFTYQSYEYIGEMIFVFTNCKLQKLLNAPDLLQGNEFSTIEVDFLNSRIRFYKNGQLISEKNLVINLIKESKTSNPVVYYDPSLSKGYKHRF